MGCNCGGKATTYQVKYPNGGTRTFLTKQEATVAASAVPGATVIEVSK